MKDGRKHNTLLTGMCAAVLVLVLAAGCQGTTPLVTYTVDFAVNSSNGTLKAVMNGKSIRSGAQAVKDQTVTVTAEPHAGYETGTWTVTGGTILSGGESGDKSVTVKIISDTTVKVEFKKKPVQDTPKPPVPGQPETPSTQDPDTGAPSEAGDTPFVPAPFIPEYVPVTGVVLHDINNELIGEDTTLPVKLGEQFQLKPVIKPENATNKEVEYKYEENLVSVTETGLVTAIAKGIATVNIWADGKKHTSIAFQIKDDSTFVFSQPKIEFDHQASSTVLSITKTTQYSTYNCIVKYAYGNGNWVETASVSEGNIDSITVTLKENKSAFERRAYLVFKTNTAKPTLIREIPIIQKVCPNPVLTTKWIHGITEPSESDLKPDSAADVRYRKWKETTTTTWFNAKKSQDKKDDQMCWAMSTADLLHWWMKQNEDNLKRVIRKKGILPDTDQYKLYLGEYNRSLLERKSGVANVFRKRFTNNVHGTALNSAVGWYLLDMTAGGELTPQYSTDPAPGIVKGIFSDLNDLIVPRYVHNKEEFENTIKDAFDEHNALAVQFILGNNAGLHVVTVWGVEFDADENITALWVSDSNDANSHLTKFGVHYPDGRPHKINYAVANDSGKTLITDVITMKNAKQQFKNWLDSNNY